MDQLLHIHTIDLPGKRAGIYMVSLISVVIGSLISGYSAGWAKLGFSVLTLTAAGWHVRFGWINSDEDGTFMPKAFVVLAMLIFVIGCFLMGNNLK